MPARWSETSELRSELSKEWLNRGEVYKLVFELSSFGLTPNQAKIYLFLLINGTAPARRISRLLGLHRVEIYRKLRELEELGLVELHLSSPKSYSAAEPNDALSAILHRQELKMKTFRDRSAVLLAGLAKLRKEVGVRPKTDEGESSYKLVLGQRRYINELRSQMKRAQHEVLRIVSAGGVVRTFLAGLDEAYLNAKGRGVSIRMITTVTPRNRKYVEKLSEVAQVKHVEGIRLRFTVVDKSTAILAAKFDENSMSISDPDNNYLVFEDERLAEAFCFFFEHLWTTARPFRPRG